MRGNRRTMIALAAALLGAAACDGGEGGEGALNEMEDATQGTSIAPDTSGPGYRTGMGGGSIEDTLPAPAQTGDTAVHEAVDSAMRR